VNRRPVKRFEWLDAIVGTKAGRTPSDLDRTERAVVLALFSHMDEVGTCDPGPALLKLAKGAGVARSTVDRALVRLERRGWLLVVRSRGRTSNVYRAAVPTGAPGEPVGTGASDAPVVASNRSASRAGSTGAFEGSNRSVSAVQQERQARHEAVEAVEATPLPPQSGGRRSNGTNPRALERERRIANARSRVCPKCEMGGGMHAADCPRVTESEAVWT